MGSNRSRRVTVTNSGRDAAEKKSRKKKSIITVKRVQSKTKSGCMKATEQRCGWTFKKIKRGKGVDSVSDSVIGELTFGYTVHELYS